MVRVSESVQPTPVQSSRQAGGYLLRRVRRANPLTGMNWTELWRAYGVFLNNPSQGILHILAAGENSNWVMWVNARLRKQARRLETAVITIDIPQLLKLPADTLGGAYARHLTEQGFDPEAFVRSTQQDWLDYRLAVSHDVHHVITGFNGSPVGEFGLAAFVLLQYRDLLNSFVLSFVPWYMMGHILQVPQVIAAVLRGLRMGMQCRAIVAYPFESHWHKSLIDVRRDLGLTVDSVDG